MKQKDKDPGKRNYERRNGMRRKKGKKKSIRDVTLKEREREFQKDRRIEKGDVRNER